MGSRPCTSGNESGESRRGGEGREGRREGGREGGRRGGMDVKKTGSAKGKETKAPTGASVQIQSLQERITSASVQIHSLQERIDRETSQGIYVHTHIHAHAHTHKRINALLIIQANPIDSHDLEGKGKKENEGRVDGTTLSK